MSSKMLCTLMRVSVIAVTVCGLILCTWILPSFGTDIIENYPEYQSWFLPWVIFIAIISLPIFCVLIYIWKVAGAVKHEEVFTVKVARWIKSGAILIFADIALLFLGNFILLLIGMNHPGVFLLSMFGSIFAIALAVLAAILSRYITKAALLQEENEGTI